MGILQWEKSRVSRVTDWRGQAEGTAGKQTKDSIVPNTRSQETRNGAVVAVVVMVVVVIVVMVMSLRVRNMRKPMS